MDRRHFLGQLGLIGLGVGFAWVFSATFLNVHADRRFTLYNIRRELHKDMPRSEVDAIVSRHDTPFIMKHSNDNKLSLSVSLGGRDYLYLGMEFLDGKLAKAYFGGEDNPWDVPKTLRLRLNDQSTLAAEQSLAADAAIVCFSSNLVPSGNVIARCS